MKKRINSSEDWEELEDVEVTSDNVEDVLYEIIDLNGSEAILNAFIAYMPTSQLVDYTETLIREEYI